MSGLDDASREPGGATIADSIVRGFTEFATHLDHTDVGETAFHAAKRCLVDAIGCGLAGQATEVVEALRSVASTVTSSRPATLFGTTIRTTPELAAFVNGSTIRCLDFNDDYFGSDRTNAHGDTRPSPERQHRGRPRRSRGRRSRRTDHAPRHRHRLRGLRPARRRGRVRAQRLGPPDLPLRSRPAPRPAACSGWLRSRIANAIRLAVVPNVCLYETRVGCTLQLEGSGRSERQPERPVRGADRRGRHHRPRAGLRGAAGLHETGRPPVLPRPVRRRPATVPDREHLLQAAPPPLRDAAAGAGRLGLRRHGRPRPDRRRCGVHGAQVRHLARARSPRCGVPRTGRRRTTAAPTSSPLRWCTAASPRRRSTPERFTDPLVLRRHGHHRADRGARLHRDLPVDHVLPVRDPALNDGRVLTVHGDNPKGHPRRPMSDDEIDDKFLDRSGPDSARTAPTSSSGCCGTSSRRRR